MNRTMPTMPTRKFQQGQRGISGLDDCSECRNECPLTKLAEAELQALSPVIGKIHRPKWSIIFEDGDSALQCYLICKGEIELLKHLNRGGNHVLQTALPGDSCGVEEILTKQDSYRSSARVREDALLRTIPRAEFMHLLQTSAAFCIEVMQRLAQQKLKLQKKLSDFTEMPACRRLAITLLDLAETHGHRTGNTIEITTHLTNQHLAELVGITPETISTLLRALKKKGLVTRRGQTFILRKVEELQHLS